MKFVFASTNKGKLSEVKEISRHLGLELLEIDPAWGHPPEIEEGIQSYQENALLKAKGFYNWCNHPVVADDTGLEVTSLNGAPGIKSARFAGINATMVENKALLLSLLKTQTERSAVFRSVLCYFDGHTPVFSEATLSGFILDQEKGNAGFGYDGLFQVEGYTKTLSELKSENFIETHRMKAFRKLFF